MEEIYVGRIFLLGEDVFVDWRIELTEEESVGRNRNSSVKMLSQHIFLPSNEVNNKNSSDKTGSNQQKEEKGFSSVLYVRSDEEAVKV